jgi:CheY-like chemotaxis protein
MPLRSYSENVTAAFIAPIRSVLAIDDQFPTLDLYISGGAASKDQTHISRLARLLEYCRQEGRNWSVDVHDGQETVENLDTPVRSCDWLILDYNLNDVNGKGGKAIEIVRRLASTEHFNLVVIYTGEPAEDVHADLRVALSDFSKIKFSDADQQAIDAIMDGWEDRTRNIRKTLQGLASVKTSAFLKDRHFNFKHKDCSAILGEFNRHTEAFADSLEEKIKVYQSLIFKTHLKLSSGGKSSHTLTASKEDAPVRWVLADNVFVTIVEKETEPDKLIDRVQTALENWKPSPNRLALAKFRSSVLSAGMKGDNEILSDRSLQAFWLSKLFDCKEDDEDELSHQINVLVDRQIELLTDKLRSSVVEFTAGIIRECKSRQEKIDVYFGDNALNEKTTRDAMVSHNTWVSSKEPQLKNLVPGHVMEITFDDSVSHWICLSPACDLVAKRENGRDLKKRISPWMPFTAVRIHPINSCQRALELATKNWIVFIKNKGVMEQYSFFADLDLSSNPVWEEFYAKDEGKIEANTLKLTLLRVRRRKPRGAHPTFEECSARVVTQLRSEYAANLTFKLTGNLSRIGLDFYGIEKKPRA